MRSPHKSLRRLLMLVIVVALAVPTLGAAAPLVGDNFEADDGNLIVNTLGNVDWNTAGPRVDVDLPSANDNSFTQGAQEDNPVETWGVTTAPVNAKADIIRTYTKSAFQFFRLGIVRNQQANGTVAYHVEFNQSTAKHPNGLPVRTVGDALVVYDFQGNDTQATLTLHRWIASGVCATNTAAPCWGTGTTLDATQAIAANNQADVLDTVANPDETLAPKTFDELAINLATSLGLPQNGCINFGQVWLRTREGGAFGSALQDLMGPTPIHVGNCDVAIEKDVVAVNGTPSVNPASAPLNATLEYRIRVFLGPNSTPVAADQLAVSDTTVSDPLFTNAPLVPVLVNGTIVGDDGDNILEQGERWVYALNAIGTPVIQGATTCAPVVNSAEVAVTGGDTDLTNNKATRTTPVACVPDIAIQKSGPASVNFGSTITYTVDVTNVGDPLPIPRADIHVTDPAVTGGTTELVFSSETNGNGDTLLDPGEAWAYSLPDAPLTLPANQCTPIDNTAIVAQLASETNPDNNQSTVTTNVICTLNLTIAKTSDKATYAAGETITYTVTVTNTGQSVVPFAAIQVSDPTLSGLALVGEPPAELLPGQSVTYTGTRQTTPADCGSVPNTATVALNVDAQETTLEDNSATHTVTVTCTTDIAVAKHPDKATYAPGETITYSVTVTNTGQLAIPFSAIQVSDPALPNLTLVGTAPQALSPGEILTYTGTRQVTAANCGQVPNTATVALVGDVPTETTTANNTSSVSVAVAGSACSPVVVVTGDQATRLSITKVGPKSSLVRQAVRYTLRITNTGPVVARNVIVRDPVPSGMTVAKLPINATFSKGQLRWRIGDLQPGQSVRVQVLLRAERNLTRKICNVGFASGSNAPQVSARACTRFLKVGGAVRIPVVTG